ncbi:beta-glucosidase 1-like [Primulina huaijiensis]|uniref:beta-glucosidase 1-like n=1 Tax=Primulina huaijiensis TaxID=1492673 RepID=UPI003CC753B7
MYLSARRDILRLPKLSRSSFSFSGCREKPFAIARSGQKIRRNGTLEDTARVEYLHAYIGAVLEAVRNGLNTKGYFVWTFLDCFELLDDFESSYGMYYVDLDYKDLKRNPKLSAHWYSNFLKGKSMEPQDIAKLGNNTLFFFL